MPSAIIQEFMTALDQEIAAIKKGKGGSIVKVFNGRFLREVSGLFIYAFNLENFLAVLDDSPAEIEIRGNRYSAQVLLTQGLEVEIGIERFCGQHVSEAKLQTNLWYLLELLKKKFTEAGSDGSSLSEGLLTGKSFPLVGFDNVVRCGHCGTKNRLTNYVASRIPICGRCKNQLKPDYSSSTRPPNPAQMKAIDACFFSQLAVIWGPPGTGKTTTVAQAIEAHLNAGRRVLLVSHANAAVDEALQDVAEQLRATPFYNEGKLVRLGTPQSSHLEKLTQRCPLVLLDRIAEKLGESLSTEKRNLEEEKLRLDGTLDKYENLYQALQVIKNLSSELATVTSEQSASANRLSEANNELRRLEEVQKKNREKLIQAQSSGSVKRFFSGLDPHKIQREIDQTTIKIDSARRLLNEIGERIRTLKDSRDRKQGELENRQASTNDLLRRMGVSPSDLENKKKELTSKRDNVLARLAEINQQLDEIQKKILSEARLIATTLTKTFTAKQFPDAPFDVVIIDEASMAPLPHLYWAVSRCHGHITIVGDFLQLPPICIAEEGMAQKWLGRSVFSVLGIDQVKRATQDQRVTLLDTQYRMAPKISEIPNRFFYQHLLKDDPSTVNRSLDDGISISPLVLVDTQALNPWCSRLSKGGRFNLYNAVLSCTVAKQVMAKADGRIGVIAPYAAQARLINKIAKDWGILDRIRTSTVHRFQGGEESIIIFDTVEGSGTKVAPMLDDKKPDSDARRLLNVAVSRAKYRFYLIADTKHLLSDLHEDATLARMVQHFRRNAHQIPSETFVDSYFTSDFERWAEAFLSSGNSDPVYGQMYTERNFWARFFQDIKSSQHRVIILSPFLSVRRSGIFMDYFRSMRQRGIDLRVYTRPRNQQGGEMANQADIVVDQLRSIGVDVIERRSMHQKVAIIDDGIAWEGSLNILSHRDTGEHMRRFEGPSTVEEIIRNLELDDDMPSGSQTGEKCPERGFDGFLVVRSKYGRKFLGCSNYAKKKCRYTRPL